MSKNRTFWSKVSGLGMVAALIAAPARAAEPLKVVGSFRVMEMAPLLTAAEAMPGLVTVSHGGIANLWPDAVETAATATGPKGTVADIAGNAETQALLQSVKQTDLRIILTVTEGNYRMMARRSSDIRNLADLKGKRIATSASTSAAYYLHKMLARADLTATDVTIVNFVPAQLKKGGDMLIDGGIDALALWEPEPERARQALGDNAIELFEFGAYRELYNLNATAATLADPVKRKQIVSYVRALLTSCHDATYRPARAQELVAKNTGYDFKLIEAAWPHHRWACNLPTDLADVLAEEEKWLAAQDKRPPRDGAQLAKLIDPSILAEAQKK